MEESLEEEPWNDEEHLRARLSNPPENVEDGDVGLNFQLKMLEFMDFVNQKLKGGKKKRAQQDKRIKLFIIQDARLSSSIKQLAKVIMPNIFFGLDKARKMKEFFLEMNNYYDVQMLDKDDKVSIVVTLLNDHAFQW